MRKTTKIWIVIATFLVLVGCIILGGVMTMFKWDFAKLSTNKYETKNYEINEDFNAISIRTDTADITFVPAIDAKCSVECYEQKNVTYSVAVKDDTLVIETIDSRKWYEHIGINIGTPKITVSLPKAEYTALAIKESTGDVEIPKDFRFENVDISLSTGDVNFLASASKLIKIKTSTGKICVENTCVGGLELSASTGEITVSNVICEGDVNIYVSTGKTNLNHVACKNLTSRGSTGNIVLSNVVATGKLTIKQNTGNVKFDSSDGAEIFVETDTGDVRGTLLSEKIFITESDSGKIRVPKTTSGGKCEIITSTGNIKIDVTP